jgi:hypothetical protein
MWGVHARHGADTAFNDAQSLLSRFGLETVKKYDGSELQGLPGAAPMLHPLSVACLPKPSTAAAAWRATCMPEPSTDGRPRSLQRW